MTDPADERAQLLRLIISSDVLRPYRRTILKIMTAYILFGAVMGWIFAQITLALMPHLQFPRDLVGLIAVAVVIVTPLFGSVCSFGLWWWDPYPGRRARATVARLFAGLCGKLRRGFTRRPRRG